VRLAEHECEGENEELVIEIVADMHNPVAPVFRAAFHDERPDEAGRAVTDIHDFRADHFDLTDYHPHPSIGSIPVAT